MSIRACNALYSAWAGVSSDTRIGPLGRQEPRPTPSRRLGERGAPPDTGERLSPAKVLERISRARLQQDELDAELTLLVEHAVSLRIGWPDIATTPRNTGRRRKATSDNLAGQTAMSQVVRRCDTNYG